MAKVNTQGNLRENVTQNDQKRQESSDSTIESQGRLNFDPNSMAGNVDGVASETAQESSSPKQAASTYKEERRKAAMERMAILREAREESANNPWTEEDELAAIAKREAEEEAEFERELAEERAREAARLSPNLVPVQEPQASGQSRGVYELVSEDDLNGLGMYEEDSPYVLMEGKEVADKETGEVFPSMADYIVHRAVKDVQKKAPRKKASQPKQRLGRGIQDLIDTGEREGSTQSLSDNYFERVENVKPSKRSFRQLATDETNKILGYMGAQNPTYISALEEYQEAIGLANDVAREEAEEVADRAEAQIEEEFVNPEDVYEEPDVLEEEPDPDAEEVADEVFDELHSPGERFGEPIKKGARQAQNPDDKRTDDEKLKDVYNKSKTEAWVEDAIYEATSGEYVSKRKAERLDQEKTMQDGFMRRVTGGAYPLSGDTPYIDPKTGDEYDLPSENVQKEMAKFCKFFGVNPDHPWVQQVLYNTVTQHLSAAPDMDGKLFGKDLSENPEMPDEVFIWALRDIMQNVMRGEHPHHYNGMGINLGGTEAIPNPILTSAETAFYVNFYNGDSDYAKKLKDAGKGFTLESLIEESVREWNEVVHPALLQKKAPQRKAIEAYVRFVVRECYPNISLRTLHLYTEEDITIGEILEEFEDEEGEKFGPHIKEQREFVKAMSKRSIIDQQKSRGASAFKGGKFGAAVDKAEDAGMVFLHNAANVRAVTSVALDVQLVGTNAVEAAVGNFELGLGNKARMALFTKEEYETFAPTTATYCFCEDAAARETLEAAETVRFVTGSAEASAVFLNACRDAGIKNVTVEQARRWLEEHYGNMPSDPITDRLNKVSQGVYSIQSGDWLTRGSDAKLFVQNYLINQRNIAKSGGVAITAKQLEGSFVRDPGATMLDMLCSIEGQQAYWLMRGRTMGGAFIASERYNKFARHHPLMGDLTKFFISTFPEFSIKAVTKMNPFMHTTAWLSTAAGAIWKKEVSFREAFQEGGSAKIGQHEYGLLLASNDIRECLLLDLMKCSSIAFKTLVVRCFLLALGGIDDPEESKDKGKWDMYRLGCEYDENGKVIQGTGFNFRQMWYLNDLLGFAGPAAIAVSVFLKNHDADEAASIMIDGMEDIYCDLAPGKIADFLLGWEEDYEMSRLAAYGKQSSEYQEDWVVKPDDWFDFMTTKLMITGVDLLTDSSTIRVIESLFAGGVNSNSYAPDIFHVYTEDPTDDPTNITSVTDYTELQMRKLASQNVMAGVLFNVFTGVYWQSREIDKTGFTKYEQPIMKTTDIVQKVHWEMTKDVEMTIDEDTGKKTIVSSDEDTMSAVNYIYNLLDQVDNAEEAYESGYCFASGARYAAISYAWLQIGQLMDERSLKLAEAWGSWDNYQERKLEIYDEFESAAARWYKYVNCLLDWDIPDYPHQYNLWETNLQAYYMDENGEDVSRSLYTLRNLPGIKELADAASVPQYDVEYENFGDYDNPLQFLASTSVNLDQTWNAETRLAWQGASTDKDFVLSTIEGALATSGNDKGELVSDIITAYGQNEGDFVLGRRAYTPTDQSLRMDYTINPYNNDFWMPEDSTTPSSYLKDSDGNTNDSAFYNSGSGGYTVSGSSYSSSSGSSYSPKIYYTSRSVSADKAASMYAKTPYNANTTYLRPAFYTKGSREAYRRQDM